MYFLRVNIAYSVTTRRSVTSGCGWSVVVTCYDGVVVFLYNILTNTQNIGFKHFM